jgi:beta-glucanase (GH16 family)
MPNYGSSFATLDTCLRERCHGRMHTLQVIVSFLILTTSSLSADWELTWADEFEQDGLPDPAKWTYEEGFVRNRELQYYTANRLENARIENGVLIIEARKERFPNPRHQPDASERRWQQQRAHADYTSASLTTRGRAEWTYGRIEVRAKLPGGRGTWPAIWMLGTNMSEVGWPACGEIDIMEYVGHHPGVVHANVHTRGYNHTRGNGRGAQIKVPDAETDFHVYAVEWTPEHLKFFVDDEDYFTLKNDGTGVDSWPFDAPHYLILNLAIGGAWGGQQGIDDSIFPQPFLIDYVRVYRRP